MSIEDDFNSVREMIRKAFPPLNWKERFFLSFKNSARVVYTDHLIFKENKGTGTITYTTVQYNGVERLVGFGDKQ